MKNSKKTSSTSLPYEKIFESMGEFTGGSPKYKKFSLSRMSNLSPPFAGEKSSKHEKMDVIVSARYSQRNKRKISTSSFHTNGETKGQATSRKENTTGEKRVMTGRKCHSANTARRSLLLDGLGTSISNNSWQIEKQGGRANEKRDDWFLSKSLQCPKVTLKSVKIGIENAICTSMERKDLPIPRPLRRQGSNPYPKHMESKLKKRNESPKHCSNAPMFITQENKYPYYHQKEDTYFETNDHMNTKPRDNVEFQPKKSKSKINSLKERLPKRMVASMGEKEIINLSFGSGACTIMSNFFWPLVCSEMGLHLDGSIDPTYSSGIKSKDNRRFGSLFSFHSKRGIFKPRCLFIDGGPETIHRIRTFGKIYHDENFACGNVSGNGNFARSYYSLYGDVLANQIVERLRRIEENCDYLQGYISMSCIGGGIGSGVSVAILEDYLKLDKSKQIINLPVFPDSYYSTSEYDIYNTVFSLCKMSLNGANFVIDNQALYDTCSYNMKVEPTLMNMNQLIAKLLSSITSPFRFYSTHPSYSTIEQLTRNVVRCHPYHMNFAIPSLSTTTTNNSFSSKIISHGETKIIDVTKNCMEPKNWFVKTKETDQSKCISLNLNYQTSNSSQTYNHRQIEDALASMKNRKRPSNKSLISSVTDSVVKFGVQHHPKVQEDIECCMLLNSTAISEFLRDVKKKFELPVSKKAYFNKFTKYGMEDTDFEIASDHLTQLIQYHERHEHGLAP